MKGIVQYAGINQLQAFATTLPLIPARGKQELIPAKNTETLEDVPLYVRYETCEPKNSSYRRRGGQGDSDIQLTTKKSIILDWE